MFLVMILFDGMGEEKVMGKGTHWEEGLDGIRDAETVSSWTI